MLVGCSSKLLSLKRRLRGERLARFQDYHFLSMSTQRFDMPRSFPRREAARLQPIRPIGLSVDVKTSSGCSLRQNICKSLRKRHAEESSFDDEACVKRAKRKKRCSRKIDDCYGEGERLSLGQGENGGFWLQSGFDVPCTVPSIAGLSEPQLFSSLTCSQDEEEELYSATGFGNKDVKKSQDSVSLERKHALVERPSKNTCESNGLELVNCLVSCVESIISKNIPRISHLIRRLGELSSPRGGLSIHRVAAYFTEALAIRAGRTWPHIFHAAPCRGLCQVDDDNGTTMSFFNEVSPIPRFIYFTANEILLRAFEGKDRVHIIDFDIKQGLQWPSFFQSLASRTNPPTRVRITGIGDRSFLPPDSSGIAPVVVRDGRSSQRRWQRGGSVSFPMANNNCGGRRARRQRFRSVVVLFVRSRRRWFGDGAILLLPWKLKIQF